MGFSCFSWCLGDRKNWKTHYFCAREMVFTTAKKYQNIMILLYAQPKRCMYYESKITQNFKGTFQHINFIKEIALIPPKQWVYGIFSYLFPHWVSVILPLPRKDLSTCKASTPQVSVAEKIPQGNASARRTVEKLTMYS